jgi:sigma-B regulation protein RsbU (phosphoserine phosphatase)
MPSDERFDILVVDDSDEICRYLKVTLERAGYNVRLCSGGLEACREIASDPPDFVVSDWQMPEMDGAELCEWVRGRDLPHYIYFILITAHEQVFDVVDGLDSGADDYVQKPIKIDELLARLRSGERIVELERRLRAPAQSVTSYDII